MSFPSQNLKGARSERQLHKIKILRPIELHCVLQTPMAADKGKKRRQFLPHNRPVKKKGAYPLRPGIQGFFITCDGGRERQASHEAIYVLDSVSFLISFAYFSSGYFCFLFPSSNSFALFCSFIFLLGMFYLNILFVWSSLGNLTVMI